MPAPVIGTRPRHAPTSGATVDPGHPLANGLEFCYVPSVNPLVDLARGYVGTRVGTIRLAATERGIGLFAPDNVSRLRFDGVPDAPFIGNLTLLFHGLTRQALGTYAFIAGKGGSGATAWAFDMFGEILTPRPLRVTRSNSAGAYRAYDRTSWVTDEVTTYVGTFPSTLSATAFPSYLNGVYASGTPQSTGTGNVAGGGKPLYIGARDDSLNANVITNIFAAWSRQVSQAEAAMLYANPFCFLRY